MMMRIACLLYAMMVANLCHADWRVTSPHDHRQSLPGEFGGELKPIQPGDKLPDENKFKWLVGDLRIPEEIDGQLTAGQPVGIRINAGDGGEVYLNGTLRVRFDNDHPALVLVSPQAQPGQTVRLAVQVYGKVQGGDTFDEATWVIVDAKRALGAVELRIDAGHPGDPVPDGIVGLSQGGGMSDYEDATCQKLKEGGFKWFRMDNIFTGVVKAVEDGKMVYDWTDFDRRVDFIHQMGAEPIFAVSYMPIPLDAVPDNDRHSAPRDYKLWEELCYQAAKRCVERGKRVPWWEVWNEANSGWIVPGPQDEGTEPFRKLYSEALGREEADQGIIRRFEAYCRLYQATARGVCRADPQAKVGGPALASGPSEREDCSHCHHGKGFARGLMLWCRQEKLPLDFVSWHEYFHPADVIARQADTFRAYLADFPEFQKSVKSFMLTEWNEAWWPNRPQDHEVGAAWCADGVIRAFLPHGIDRPCFFYVKQGDMGFRGDWSMIMQGNTPKPTYHMAKMFNGLSGRWLPVAGGDGDVCAVASWDVKQGRLAVIAVNFQFRYALGRNVRLSIEGLPRGLARGQYRVWTVDATHSNVWNDRNQAELAKTDEGRRKRGPAFTWESTLEANSVTLIELLNPRAEK